MRFLLTTQFIIDENVSQMSNVTRAIESIMGGRNEQAFLRSCNDLQTWNVLSKQITREANEVPESHAGTVAIIEVNTNADICCLGNNFIPLAYTNRSAVVYPYNYAYNSIENIPTVSEATAYNNPNGTAYILFFTNRCIMEQRFNIA